MQTNTNTNLHYSLNQTLKNKVFKSKSHSMNTFKNKSSYSFKRTLSISIITSILLSNQLVLANPNLPSGGKFTNGSSGSINIGKGQGSCTTSNCMSISGNNKNNVIAWGGGFNIGNGYKVNFEKGKNGGNNYLNLDYSKNPSKIAGLLEGNNNNIFLVNPSGVLVTESGSINANRFVASTTPLTKGEIDSFSDSANSANWSPVFKPNGTKGDIVINTGGQIKSKEVFLVGNKVEILDKDVSIKGNQDLEGGKDYANKIDIKGNNVYINGDTLTSKEINIQVKEKGSFTTHIGDYYNKYKSDLSNLGKYTFSGEGLDDFQALALISDKNDWIGFANSWNNSEIFRNISFQEFRVTNNINMENVLVDAIGHTYAFNKNFNGNGYTLSNIKINANQYYAGLFGKIEGDNLKIGNIKIDNLNFDYQEDEKYWPRMIGGFIGYINGSGNEFSNIVLNNIGAIQVVYAGFYMDGRAGGFTGYIGGDNIFLNINLNNIVSIRGNLNDDAYAYAGGFAGEIKGGEFNNINLNNIGGIRDVYIAGGFAGEIKGGELNNITINNIGDIDASKIESSIIGGFAGLLIDSKISNITLKDVGEIIADSKFGNAYAGGFAGWTTSNTTFKNIYIYFREGSKIEAINSDRVGKFIGLIENSNEFSNIHIYYKKGTLENADSDSTYYDKGINLHTYTNSTQGQQDFINAVLNDEALKQAGIYQDSNGNLSFFKPFEVTPPNNDNEDNDNNSDSGLSDVILSEGDFSKEILYQILADLDFDLLNDDIDSIIQTLDFLRYFNKEDIGIQSLFSEDYTLANNNQSNNLFNNFNKIVEKIKEDKKILEAYQKDVEKFNKDYELYLDTKGDMTEEALAGLEKELKQRQEALLKREKEVNNLIDSFNKSMQDNLYANFELNKETPMFNNNPLIFTLNLTPLNKGGIGGNGGGDSDQTITTPLKDINSSMLDKQKVVLVKPAEEEKEALDEEKGTLNSRTCIVSENFKTNNPCMAQRI